MAWIYAFTDCGYDSGIKVGRCGSATGLAAWDDAPSYSPRPMHYVAGWQVQFPLTTATGRVFHRATDLEHYVHDLCAPALSFPRNGREWFDIDGPEAIRRISHALDFGPTATNRHRGITVANDQFRNPHPRRLSTGRFKVVAWIYEEHLTGRVKTQLVDDWTTPTEIRRRYSRNGFAERHAFTYEGPVVPAANIALFRAWQVAMQELGPGPLDQAYGWLNEGVTREQVASVYLGQGFAEVTIDRDSPPSGVRKAYNRAE